MGHVRNFCNGCHIRCCGWECRRTRWFGLQSEEVRLSVRFNSAHAGKALPIPENHGCGAGLGVLGLDGIHPLSGDVESGLRLGVGQENVPAIKRFRQCVGLGVALQPAVNPQDAADQLHAEVRIAAGAHGNQREGARGIESQGHGHFEDQDFALFVVGQCQQVGIRFHGGVDGDLLLGETQAQQPLLQLFNALLSGVRLHEQQRHERHLHLNQFLF